MKKFASILLSLALCASMSALAVSADAVMGTWTKVSDTEYSAKDHQNGNDYFDYYELGKDDEVTLSADIVATGDIPDTNDDPQRGFLLGVVDLNGDGKITEGGDQYYLICFQNGKIAIERNDQRWSGWARENVETGVAEGETCTLKVTFKHGSINVYANDKLIVEYADANPWENGTGFGLAYKFGDEATFKNVSVDTETPVKNTLGSGSVDLSKAEEEGNTNTDWTVDGNTYTLNIATREEGYGNARFASYVLGNSTEKVTVTGKYTFNEFNNWGSGTDSGGDNGFLFAVADMNNDGKITEGGDYYYLVDVRTDGSVAIEKNQGNWGNWAKESAALGLEVGKEYLVSASYDPATGKIVVTIDGETVLEWTDANPLSGTGYAIASKTPNFVMSDVAVVEGEVPPAQTEDQPSQTEDKPAKTGDMTALAISVATLALIGTAVIVSKKRNYN